MPIGNDTLLTNGIRMHQVDGCQFQYIKIKDETGDFRKPQVIEFFDTGSRDMLVLEFYFSETNLIRMSP